MDIELLDSKRLRNLSRRSLIASSIPLALGKLVGGPTMPARAYVGAYGTVSSGQTTKVAGGIFLCEMNQQTGELTLRQKESKGGGPSWFAAARNRRTLYTANETAGLHGSVTGPVSAFRVAATGELALLNAVSSGGAGPVYISLHPSGKFLFVANYAAGSVAVLRLERNGSLGSITDVQRDNGPLGNAKAANAPPGSFAVSGHDHPHAHMIAPDPTGRFVLWTDLALDRLYISRFDSGSGTLRPNDPPFVSFPSGDGPRHFQFHPNGRWLYTIQEESSTLAVFDYQAQTGRLTPRQTISTLPNGFAGTSFASELLLSKDGRFLYAGNRLHDSITCFAIGPDGRANWVSETWTGGDYPRQFSFDPSGRFLFCCNQRADSITSFRADKATGLLTSTGNYTPIPGPAAIFFET